MVVDVDGGVHSSFIRCGKQAMCVLLPVGLVALLAVVAGWSWMDLVVFYWW